LNNLKVHWTLASHRKSANCGGYQQMSMPEGGESMMMEESTMMSTEVIVEPFAETQALDLQDTIQFLEQLWLDDPELRQQISEADWQAFMDLVYQSLADLETETVQLE
jgi:hypothetical protein